MLDTLMAAIKPNKAFIFSSKCKLLNLEKLNAFTAKIWKMEYDG